MKDEVICGIEIHQQLDTKKLFCACDTDLVEEEGASFLRRLRPTTSEMGEIDRAALMEAEKRMRFRYQAPRRVTCLVDADEEPPHRANEEAMDITLTFAEMVKAKVVDEVHFMRKIVIDGSNTTGFQRTSLVAMDGTLEVNGKAISIQSVCLEEDAARKVETSEGEVTYRLDRLGIPLIEVATGPDMRSPEEVREVALRIGTLLRSTKRVKRGIGTIREDLNISIPGGARIEIKGVQELRMLPTYVEVEMRRQQSLLRIREILRERCVKPVPEEILDVTSLFEDCPSKVIGSALKANGNVLAIALRGYAGVLNGDDGKLRLGSELAQRARTKGVKGIFHSDELPAYGIEEGYVTKLRSHLDLENDDAFAICAAGEERAKAALLAAVERANEAIFGVPEETRDPMPDGTTKYSRPLPGAARMYPETDVPPITIENARLEMIRTDLPELPEETIARLVRDHGIHEQQARQLVREGREELFERLADTGLATLAASTLLETFTELERGGDDPSLIPESTVIEVFGLLVKGEFAKEALPSLFGELAKGTGMEKAIDDLGLRAVDVDEAGSIIASIVREREDFVREKGLGAIGPLMGAVMQELRGKLDGKKANQLLREEIERLLA
jgi:glutamyl-tRNA(Gln) amidotransferase subunit E